MTDLIRGLQGPRTARQELFYDLEDAASIIGWAVVQLSDMAGSEANSTKAQALKKICELMSLEQTKLSGYADEVKAGTITRPEAS
ncbi:hypothetical protein [Pseudomonas sp. Ant30-3]|uniref:hypothetical protein n=1 Tax=Pseudomonas sp. Ant30-3 TaxID=1488328 RepID=UPI00048AC459|nr:hypothetical protein [Pseudomonas sp. Ant30-3]